jgi:pimeloyl-ACP methyl ester carboxylesterase
LAARSPLCHTLGSPNSLLSRALAFARIESHYFVNGGWLSDGQLIEEAYKIKHLPIAIIQGRYDLVCPAKTSWELYQALGGHGNSNVEYRIIKYVGLFVLGTLQLYPLPRKWY